jgi:hypothetical protein
VNQLAQDLDEIHRRICAICIDAIQSDHDQLMHCARPPDQSCPLRDHLPKLIEVVRSVESPWMDDYVRAIREGRCSPCGQAEDPGACALRGATDCALEHCVGLVLRALEQRPPL